MAGHYAEDRWLWAHLSDLAQEDKEAADAVVGRLSNVERARWWHEQSRERWGLVTVSDHFRWMDYDADAA